MLFLVKACHMDQSNIDKILSWAEKKEGKEHAAFTKVKRSIGKKVAKWKTDGVPVKSLRSLETVLPTITRDRDTQVCTQGFAMPQLPMADDEARGSPANQVQAALAGMTVKPVSPR